MKENFQAQIILATGAGSGIGRTTAIELARAGNIVYASMRVADLEGERWASLRSVGLEERLNLRPLEPDVREEASCRGKRKGVSQVSLDFRGLTAGPPDDTVTP